MSDAFISIKQGLKKAIEFVEGEENGARIFTPSEIDVKKLRKNIGMTQVEFATVFGISLGTF